MRLFSGSLKSRSPVCVSVKKKARHLIMRKRVNLDNELKR